MRTLVAITTVAIVVYLIVIVATLATPRGASVPVPGPDQALRGASQVEPAASMAVEKYGGPSYTPASGDAPPITVIGEPLYVVRDSRKHSDETRDGFRLPDTGTEVRGTATWYCGGGSACTRGYGPSDLVAAIDRKDSPFRKGDRVVVRSGGKRVVVTIVDVCACRGRRVIDLTSGAFSRLAPLSRGVIAVTIEGADDEPLPTLPATDTGEERP